MPCLSVRKETTEENSFVFDVGENSPGDTLEIVSGGYCFRMT